MEPSRGPTPALSRELKPVEDTTVEVVDAEIAHREAECGINDDASNG